MSVFEKPSTACEHCGATLPAGAPEGLCPRCLARLNLWTKTEAPGEQNGQDPASPPAPPLAPAELARLFPHLEILECLGRGGMGTVYRARQPLLKRFVALKVLAPEKEKAPEFAERFMREAQALARLNHPGIVTVYDFGEVQDLYYLLMEFVDGLSLRQLLRNRRLVPEEALAIVPRICEALQYAHEQDVVHRDIKPENILLDKQGRVKIADFGIAKILGQSAGDRALTAARDIVGTPYYMAPEQVERPAKVDHRADIYSLGVVLYEMLTGELPLGKFAPPSRKVHVDVRLDQIVLHALEKEPDRRYQHVSEVKVDMETLATPAPGSLPVAGKAAPGVFRDRRRRLAWDGLAYSLALLLFGLLSQLPYVWVPGLVAALGSAVFLGLLQPGGWSKAGLAGGGQALLKLALASLMVLALRGWMGSAARLRPAENAPLAASPPSTNAPPASVTRAFAFGEQLPVADRRKFLDSILASWTQRDTEAALRWAEQLPDAQERAAALKAIRSVAPAGIGVELGLKDGLVVINKLSPGMPAEQSGLLQAGDRILAVAEEDQPFMSLHDLNQQELLQAIRGEPGTRLRLQVLPAAAPTNSTPRIVSLVRGQYKYKQ